MINPFRNIQDSSFIQGVEAKTENSKEKAKNWLLHQGKWAFLVIFCTFIYMDNRMVCDKQLKRIDRLTEQLEEVKYISTIKETELLRAGRQTEIEKLVKEKGLDLVNPDIPPYKIEDK